MPTATGTIDLGELPHGEPIQVEEAWPVRERLRRLRPRHLRWAAIVVSVMALVLATTGGAGGQPRPALVLHAAFGAAGYAVDQENLYVLDDPPGPVDTRLTAYALATGATRWQITLDAESAWVEADGVLLLVTYSVSGDGLSRDQTSRLDPDTGRRLWTYDGSPSQRTGDLLLLSRPLPADIADYQWPPRNEITAVSLTTGDAAWTRSLSGWASYVGGDPARLLALSPERLELYDFRTGRLVRSAAIQAPEPAELLVAGSVAFVFDPNREVEFTAYSVETLAPLWTLEGGPNSWLGQCGALLCTHGYGPVRAIEPTTGETAWSVDWLPEAPLGSWSEVYDLSGVGLPGFLLLSRSSGAGFLERSWLVEAETGEPVLDLREWVLTAYSLWGPAPEPPMATWYENGVTWIGRLRPDLSGVDPIGSIEVSAQPGSPFPGCVFPDGFVVCGGYPVSDTESGELTVWRIR